MDSPGLSGQLRRSKRQYLSDWILRANCGSSTMVRSIKGGCTAFCDVHFHVTAAASYRDCWISISTRSWIGSAMNDERDKQPKRIRRYAGLYCPNHKCGEFIIWKEMPPGKRKITRLREMARNWNRAQGKCASCGTEYILTLPSEYLLVARTDSDGRLQLPKGPVMDLAFIACGYDIASGQDRCQFQMWRVPDA
jgi:hypothetical protein